MLNKIRENRFIRRSLKKSLRDISEEIGLINADKIVICPTPTGNNWQGILSATEGLFAKENIFQIPQYFSKCIYNEKELIEIGKLIASSKFEQVIFSGYLPYFRIIIEAINKSNKSISIIYHGSHASVLEDPQAALHLKEIIGMAKAKKIRKVGFVKKDLDKTFTALTGVPCSPILLKTDENLLSTRVKKLEGINIGVLTHDSFRKNLYNQVSAALLIKDAKVHLKGKYLSDYLGNTERIIDHGYFKDRADFLKILGGMQVNLYVTFSECWGQFVNESLAMGVPCLTSDVSAVLDFDEEIKKKLIVPQFDNDWSIHKKTIEVLDDLDWFKINGPAYVKKVNSKAESVLKEFLS